MYRSRFAWGEITDKQSNEILLYSYKERMVLFKMANVTVCLGLIFTLRSLFFFLDKRIVRCYISRKQGG